MERLSVLETGDTLVLAGSIPPSVPESFTARFSVHCQGKIFMWLWTRPGMRFAGRCRCIRF